MIELTDHQKLAVERLKSGSILCGGVGSGKSLTSLFYFIEKEKAEKLLIITTARKRDSGEWEDELQKVNLSTNPENSLRGIRVIIDSWNNIGKYTDFEKGFVIFDEQRVVGYGAWVKAFLKIARNNRWILLSATPGDNWMDYIPVFIANGFYRNKSQFMAKHAVYDRFSKYPKVSRYIGIDELIRNRNKILVKMSRSAAKEHAVHKMRCAFDTTKYSIAVKNRWNVFEEKPIENISEFYFVIRKIVNLDERRLRYLFDIYKTHKKIIVFYNFNSELELIKRFLDDENVYYQEYNGAVHNPTPSSDEWAYLVQYQAGAEAWNCIETNALVFYSLNYSYRQMVQSAGRIDRLNSPFDILHYYVFYSDASIDKLILKALSQKKNFQEKDYIKS